MSIATEITRLQTAKSDLKTSIENKGVTVPSSAKLDNYADYVDAIQTGGSANIQSLSVTTNGTYTASGGVDGYSPVVVNVPSSGGGSADAVRFLDYDGTVLYTYSAADFANLNALPSNPTHSGLTSQGWNWSLAAAQTHVATYGELNIGQMYVTDDGKTRIYISLVDSARLSPYLGICPNGTVVVNWGDGTATSTLTGSSLTYARKVQHTYAATGDYVITLTATSGKFAITGTGSSSNGSYLLTRSSGDIASQRCYQNAIQKVELGTNVSVGYCAFYSCNSLASVTIPSSVTSIDTYAFQYCYSLTSVTIPSSVTSIGNESFSNCFSLTSVTLPSGVTSINERTFYSCYSLTSVTLPSGVTSIGTYAFGLCYSLTSVTLPSSVTSIDTYAFYNCYSLTSVTIPSGVTSIGTYAFDNCYSLTSVTIPSGVTSIGANTFNGCRALTSVTIPSGVTSIGTGTFSICHSLASITIPSSVTSIGTSAFSGCYSLASVTIPSGVTSIGASTFNQCTSLTSVTIPSGVTSIGVNAFQNCNSLASVTIPSSVTSIAASAFYNCYCVAEYHFLPTTPPTLANTNAFSGILADCKIYVPAASLEAYKTATNWSTYASKMVGE